MYIYTGQRGIMGKIFQSELADQASNNYYNGKSRNFREITFLLAVS
jgi:hypothetical protein